MDRQQPQPRRLLGIDPGSRRTGVALSDELGLFAHPRPAIVTDNEDSLIEAVDQIARDEAVAEVVVGLPLTMAGTDSDETRRVRELVARLSGRLGVPVTTWDERLSSVQAERTVRERGKRTGASDSAAAALILQAVIDARRGARG
jgi:putative pre-16S rRNA nuclease